MESANQDFHRERARGIGGSDWGAILNLKPYGCARRLMYEKLECEPDYPESGEGYLDRGKALEPIVADIAAEHFGVRLRKPGILPSGVAPDWWKGNPDRLVVPDGVWEGKTMHPMRFKKLKKDGIPPEHTCQVQHYIKQADRSYGLYSALDPVSWEPYHRQLARDEDLLNQMVDAGQVFWDQRLREELPARLDPGDSRCRTCQFRWTCQGQRLFDAVPELAPGELEKMNDPELVTLLFEREQLDMVLRLGKELKDANSVLIRDILQFPRNVISASGRAIYWLNYERQTLNRKAIKKKYPDIYDANITLSVVNQLRVY